MPIRHTIGKFISDNRAKKGWSQRVFAELVGIKQSRMSKLEGDLAQPRFAEVDRIALLLDQPLERFSTLRKVLLSSLAWGADFECLLLG